jgi:hypothetical protein
MPSWGKSYWVALTSVIIGSLLSILWIIIGGVIINEFFRNKIDVITSYYQQYGFNGIFYLPEVLFLGGLILFFLFLSSLCFYAILIKYTWNAISDEVQKAITRQIQKTGQPSLIKPKSGYRRPKKGKKFCLNCTMEIPKDSLVCPHCSASQEVTK